MKLLIADDHELFLKGLEFVLSGINDDITFVTAKNYSDIFHILKQDKNFDMILTDLAMPGSNWLEGISKIHNMMPDTPIIILSAVFDREIVQKTIELGVSGYISKTSSNAVIMSAINLVKSGGIYIPAELLNNTIENNEIAELQQLAIAKEANDEKLVLTPRQIDVVKLLAKGESNKQIAYELSLTEGTVKLHVTAILKILKVFNRTGAVMEATKLGIIN